MEAVSGLGGAAGVHILNNMGGTVQHQNHLAFELGWQNRLHIVVCPANAGLFLLAIQSKPEREPCVASTTSDPCRVVIAVD